MEAVPVKFVPRGFGETYRRDCPSFAIRPLLSKIFGLTTDTNRYVYLSDGGHFENLGLYELVRRNPRSEYFLSLEVSYPNDADRARAKKIGVPPGGLIMIHGQPNLPRKLPEYYYNYDWTNGCIAVSNSDMVDIWLRTKPHTFIVIRP